MINRMRRDVHHVPVKCFRRVGSLDLSISYSLSLICPMSFDSLPRKNCSHPIVSCSFIALYSTVAPRLSRPKPPYSVVLAFYRFKSF